MTTAGERAKDDTMIISFVKSLLLVSWIHSTRNLERKSMDIQTVKIEKPEAINFIESNQPRLF